MSPQTFLELYRECRNVEAVSEIAQVKEKTYLVMLVNGKTKKLKTEKNKENRKKDQNGKTEN